jgi:hypothetical protein
MPRRSRKMRGGLFGFGESNATGTSSTGTSWWDKLTGKKPTPSYYPVQSTGNYAMGQSSMGYGGKKHKNHHMKGGFASNRAGGLATYAAPISGVKNAQPQAWVGGRTRKYRGGKHRHSKSCNHRK